MTYQILTADSPGELEGKVNAEIYKGWKLKGGVSVVPVGPKPYVMGNPYGEHRKAPIRWVETGQGRPSQTYPMKQELARELEARTLRCPVCREPTETVLRKRSNYWAVIHGRGNGTLSTTTGETCRLRWEELATGKTREESENNFRQQNK